MNKIRIILIIFLLFSCKTNKGTIKITQETTEYPLYTDAHITGELTKGCEPYSFINMISMKQETGVASESILLRIGWYISGNPKCEIETDTSKYHGGWVTDEIAALASLKLGIRLKAGDMTRIFGSYSEDPLGTPRAPMYPPPMLTLRGKQPVLPNVIKTVNLGDLKEIQQLQNIKESQYIPLIRAARLYQDALWKHQYQ